MKNSLENVAVLGVEGVGGSVGGGLRDLAVLDIRVVPSVRITHLEHGAAHISNAFVDHSSRL